MLSRRRLLVSAGLAGGAALSLSADKLFAALEPSTLPMTGKAIGDFIMLPDGAGLPHEVVPARRLPPDLCIVGEADDRQTAISEPASSPKELATKSGLSLYAPELTWSNGGVMSYPDGEVYAATMSFDSYDAESGALETNVTLTAVTNFQRPLPLWEANAVEPGGPSVRLREASFLPAPGVMVKSAVGFVFHWITNGTYYMMTVDNHASLREAQRIVASLRPINP